MILRRFSHLDNIINGVDKFLRTLNNINHATRTSPAVSDSKLTVNEREHSAKLMRVNHCGEVCAQALYQGQSLTAKDTAIQNKLVAAAEEEVDHLAWCEDRIKELNSHTSYLNVMWYAGSFMIGLLAGCAGDEWSLGFLAETEHQVVEHLTDHLSKLPLADQRSREILNQMQIDEAKHETLALHEGARELPEAIKFLMKCFSKVMTTTAYWI